MTLLYLNIRAIPDVLFTFMYRTNTFVFLLIFAICSGGKLKDIKRACTAKGRKDEIEISDVCMTHLDMKNKKGAYLNSSKFMAVRSHHEYPMSYLYILRETKTSDRRE